MVDAEAFPIPDAFAMPLVKVEAEGETYYVTIDDYARLGTTPYDGKLAIRLADRAYETVKAVKRLPEAKCHGRDPVAIPNRDGAN